MNFTTLVTVLAFAAAAEAKLGGVPSFGEQLSFLESPCLGCMPDYCYPKNEAANYVCYKEGYPKCCSKSKGNCPNNKAPDCECSGNCNGSAPPTGGQCSQGDGSCKGNTFCKVPSGSSATSCGATGQCRQMNDKCDRTLKKVCGCDGVTYDNACLAFSVGVSVNYNRACDAAQIEQ